MVTMEVNGIRGEASCMQDAQRLARKEERRHTREEKAREDRHTRACDRAFACLGRLVNADRAGTLSAYLWLSADSGKTEGPDGRNRLPIRTNSNTIIVSMDSYTTIEAIGYNNADETVCVKLRDQAGEKSYWSAVGGEVDSWAFVDIPKYLTVTLDQLFANTQALRSRTAA